jgi:mRNA interferase RelE/StbE
MNEWRVNYTRTFLKELAKLPTTTRERVEKMAFGSEIRTDPLLNGQVQKLTGYQSYYKLRFGDYRVGLYLDFDNQIIEFQRVLHRREIYRKFP